MTLEIEVVSTKKKLTKSIIAQLLIASNNDLNAAISNPNRILGYVVINSQKWAIIQGILDWKKLHIDYDWRASQFNPCEAFSNKCYKRFETVEQRDEFVELYKQVVKLTTVHIYM